MDRAFNALLASLNTFASLWILFLVGLISADVILRGVFNYPLPGVPEIPEDPRHRPVLPGLSDRWHRVRPRALGH